MSVPAPHEKVLRAHQIRESDPTASDFAIAQALGVGRRTVVNWFRDPRLDPYLDQVAIERATSGDVPVYDSLTYYEMQVVLGNIAKYLSDSIGTDEDNIKNRFGSKHAPRVLKSVRRYRTSLQRDRSRPRARRPEGATAPVRTHDMESKVFRYREAGYTRKAIARRLGVSLRTIGRVLSDAA